MKEFGDIVRENVKGLQAYSCARAEFEGTNVTLLDANGEPVPDIRNIIVIRSVSAGIETRDR
ncbi:MAG: hypothetical protein V8R91_01930 [Butyricimonas faecihominis]